MNVAVDHLRFELDPLTSAPVRELIATHLAQMRSQSPACSVHALDVDHLRGADVRFWSAWIGAAVVGCGALKQLTPTTGEIKSMHVLAAWRGHGIAAKLLAHIEAAARDRGLTRLSLETGSQPAFEPARKLYTSFGYIACGPFGAYTNDPNSSYMSKLL
ncbi:GNAT family N-acetyltransferase [Enhygromyxa salina]|nr:GNAT family N-acetyltransferase [Enhygromyxa salina]